MNARNSMVTVYEQASERAREGNESRGAERRQSSDGRRHLWGHRLCIPLPQIYSSLQPTLPTSDKLSPPPSPAQKTLSHSLLQRTLLYCSRYCIISDMIAIIKCQKVDSKMNPIEWDYTVCLIHPHFKVTAVHAQQVQFVESNEFRKG